MNVHFCAKQMIKKNCSLFPRLCFGVSLTRNLLHLSVHDLTVLHFYFPSLII